MSTLDDIVTVQITLESPTVSALGFGTPMIVAHAPFSGVHTYDSGTALADMVSDGFATSSRAYKLASALLSADIKVVQLKVGSRPSAAWLQVTHVTPSPVANTTVYSLNVNGTAVSFTSDGTATLAEICTGLQTAISAVTGVTATTDSLKVVVTTTATNAVVKVNAPSNVKIEDKTADAGIVADLTALAALDDDFYGFVIDSPSELEMIAAAGWAETQVKIFAAHLSGSRPGDASDTTDNASAMHTTAYKNTFAIYHSDQTQCPDAAWLGVMMPKDPSFGGSWIFKSLGGVTGEKLSGSFITGLRSKRVNTYENKGGTYVTLGAYMFGPRFIDQTTLVHELTARIQERGWLALQNDLPYSDASGDALVGEVLSELQIRVTRGSLLANPAPVCTHPLVSSISSVDKAARHFPDINFSAHTSGGVHSVTITGKLIV